MIEIERKFLVKDDSYKETALTKNHIAQGYLNSEPARTVRVRIKNGKGYLTVKGISNKTGLSRFEWEKEIPISDAEDLLLLCENGSIDKTRYEVKMGKHLFEIDEFHGENQGLVVAEVELSFEGEIYEKPEWLDKEVTGDSRYYNSYLSNTPYKKW